jgi:hypothetical protein
MVTINCLTRDGFTDGAQVINYITKHDVEGERHERLFTMLRFLPREQIEKRVKLAFVCLLTAVGIPMMLAGEEFADEHICSARAVLSTRMAAGRWIPSISRVCW